MQRPKTPTGQNVQVMTSFARQTNFSLFQLDTCLTQVPFQGWHNYYNYIYIEAVTHLKIDKEFQMLSYGELIKENIVLRTKTQTISDFIHFS